MRNTSSLRCLTPGRSQTRKLTHLCAVLLFSVLAGKVAAQSTLTYNDGDLFLGFRSTDGTSDYLVNIGQPSQFVGASSGTSTQIAVGSIASDLTTVFGSDWYSRIDPNTGKNAVLFAVVGGRQIAAGGDPANTLYSSNPNPNPWPRQSDTAQSYTTSLIAALGNTFAGNQSTANGSQAAIQNAVASNSYASFQPGGARSNGISFQTWNPSNEARPNGRLYLDRITPGSGPSTLLGTLTLSSSGALTFTAGTNPIGQLQNIATRINVLTGDNVLIGGFIVTGKEPKSVVVRGLGPSLSNPPFNLPGTLSDPTIELRDSLNNNNLLAANDNWQDDPAQAAIITTDGLAPSDPKESAVAYTLNPGAYTVVLSGKSGATGIGVVEVYDVAPGANAQLGNLSSRGFVDVRDDQAMFGGFIVGPGSATAPRVIVLATGPSLSAFGITNPLPDPTLEIHDVNGTLIESNDNWKDKQQADIQASGLAPANELEPAIILTTAPGAYTAIVKGKGATGVATVQVYNLF